jgi:L-alanine-DL-glutamate epimerase-like enolase superfamily enzyme
MSKLVAGNPFTKAGVNMALWDALGRTLDVPVAMLLGGPFRTRVPIKLSLSGDADALAASHEEATRRGFSRFKVKVGLKPDDDVARFALARSLVGADGFLGADANGGWSRLDAAAVIPRLAEHGVAFVEQPVAPSDLEGLADLRRFGVPVLADESVFSLGDAARVARLAAADAVSLYVGKSGGLAEVVFAARMLAAFGIGSIIGSNGEMGVGAAAQIHVACACEELASIPSDIIGHHYYDADMLVTPVPIDGTWATLPPGPGLGVEPNEEAIRQLA